MRLKLYRAACVTEAMALVRAELGAEALIISTRRVAGGVELMAALEMDDEAPPPPLAPALPVEPQAPQARHVEGGGPNRHSLAFHGVPASLATRLAGPDLAAALRANLRFGTLPLSAHGPPLLLTGMPGAGKTLSVARLATRLVMAGITPLVITADGRRAGAAEELAAYTRLLELELVVASTPNTLERALGQRRPGMPALIDTAGINPFAAGELAQLQALAAVAGGSPVLVMPAGLDPDEAADQATAFLPLGIRHLLPTRLDMARRLGSLLAAAAAADLMLTEAGIGASATDGLAALTAEFLSARLDMAASPARSFPRWKPGQAAIRPDRPQPSAQHTGYSA